MQHCSELKAEKSYRFSASLIDSMKEMLEKENTYLKCITQYAALQSIQRFTAQTSFITFKCISNSASN